MAAEKVLVTLAPGPDTPRLKQNRYKLDSDKTVLFVMGWLSNTLKKAGAKFDNIFIFIKIGDSIGFSPTPEQTIGDLSELVAVEKQDTPTLSLTYCFKQTWG